MPTKKADTDAIPPVQKAFVVALAPTPSQRRAFESHAGGARFAFNWGLRRIADALDARAAQKADGQEPDIRTPSHFDLCKMWTAHKDAYRDVPDPATDRTLHWVGENFVGTYQAALRDAAVAWKNFFASRTGKRAGRALGRPRFKRKGKSRDSFQMHGSTLALVDGSHLKLPKIGTVKIPGKIRIGTWTDRNARTARQLLRLVRKGQARIVRATIYRGASGTWWASIGAEITRLATPIPTRRQRDAGTVGIDLGVKHLAVLSDGTVFDNPRHLDAALAELRVAQRALSRTQRDSRRREKARRRVGAIHERVALMRKDATNRITTALARTYGNVVVEGWDAQRLAEKGSADLPSKLRRGRNRSLADAAVGMTRWQLAYKTSAAGTRLITVDAGEPTGRTCSECGQVRAKPVPPAEELFRGPCGHVLDRRVNTARYLARIGREAAGTPPGIPAQARGADVRPKTPRRGGQSVMKRDARTRSQDRAQTGTSDP